jgi:DNA-binding NtrC family response regulator
LLGGLWCGGETEVKEKPKVLIIDNNANMCETLADILLEKGYAVVTARTASEGVEAARNWFFNIHLIDINLADKTGIELLRNFRSAYPSRINIMTTTSATLKYAVEAVNVGADAFILKPIDFASLEQTMTECLKKQQLAHNAAEERLEEFIIETSEARESSLMEFIMVSPETGNLTRRSGKTPG